MLSICFKKCYFGFLWCRWTKELYNSKRRRNNEKNTVNTIWNRTYHTD